MKLAYDVFSPKSVVKGLPPVILIHCLVETRKTWKNIAPEIARNTGRKVYAIDCRNHGESPWGEDYGSELLASDLDEFLCQHQISKAVILGHSMGGVVAMQFAVRQPNKVDKLIVEDSPARRSEHRSSNFVPLAITLMNEAYESQPNSKDEESAFQYIFGLFKQLAPTLKISPELSDTYDREALPLKWNGKTLEMQINLDAISNAVMNDMLMKNLSGTFEGSALFMYGGASQFKVDEDHLIAKHFPKAIKVGFDKAGHFIHHEYPKEFIREVSNFINEGSRQAAKL